MANARKALDESERSAIDAAIADAERRSAAEVVSAVATESGRYDRAESLFGLATALLALGLAHYLSALAHSLPGSWLDAKPLGVGWQGLAVAFGFAVGSAIASYVHGLRRLLVSRREMEQEVTRAAWAVFARERLAHTSRRGGVLVYVSLFERRVVILADMTAQAALGQEALEQARDAAVSRLLQDRLGEALVEAVQILGQRLALALPPAGAESDELPDRLLVFHPRP